MKNLPVSLFIGFALVFSQKMFAQSGSWDKLPVPAYHGFTKIEADGNRIFAVANWGAGIFSRVRFDNFSKVVKSVVGLWVYWIAGKRENLTTFQKLSNLAPAPAIASIFNYPIGVIQIILDGLVPMNELFPAAEQIEYLCSG